MTTNTALAPARLLKSGAYKRFQVMAWVTGVLLAFMTVSMTMTFCTLTTFATSFCLITCTLF